MDIASPIRNESAEREYDPDAEEVSKDESSMRDSSFFKAANSAIPTKDFTNLAK